MLSYLNAVSFPPYSDPERGAVIPRLPGEEIGDYAGTNLSEITRSWGHQESGSEGLVCTIFGGNGAPGSVQGTLW